MMIQVDSREKSRAIRKVLAEFDRRGVGHFVSKLYVGDYMNMENPRLVVDRKQSLIEVCGNVCQDHDRFRAELIRAYQAGIHVVILVEHSAEVACLEDVLLWENPRRKKSEKALSGQTLYRILQTLERKYACEFQFCDKDETGARIIEILEESNGREED